MRVIGHIEHPILKITVFKNDNKLSVKFESGLFEQIYKIRSAEEINNLGDVQKLVDREMADQVLAQLTNMHQIRNAAMTRYLPTPEANFFEEII